ncbi:hypothetical protein Cgig2_012608 [Carnegiea gigantea]|uniref:S-acyltransferase n=1 Tax=Carnegiea gigantea TaxID=171969 RepID=A0A9Q1JLL6_9CARY|nr:hypothetical protein Cgig2_012608 [Carnegiea gigantea]
MNPTSRRHGWQRPLHPLQIVGMALYAFLVASFYCFLGPFLGNRIAQISLTTIFSSVALFAMVLFIRCTAIDPSAKTRARRRYPARPKTKPKASSKSNLNCGFLLGQILIRAFRRIERKILKTFIRRKYLVDPRVTHVHLEPLLPFPLVFRQDTISPEPKMVMEGEEDDDIDVSFCSLCDSHVQKHSKHCRTCNRCVEGFDHHCRWLNNCVGKRNYTTFILLMLSVLLMLVIEGVVAITIFIRCFADKNRIQLELATELHLKFPRGLLAAISIVLVLMTAYGSAALGQLFFFHIILIRKGMRTYDYILAMREENQFAGLESLNDSDFSSDDSSEPDSPESSMSKFLCKEHRANGNPRQFASKIDPESGASIHNKGFRASIDPWKLIQMSREKALKAADKPKERLREQNQLVEHESLNPLPFEMKSGPLEKLEGQKDTRVSLMSLISKERLPTSPGRISSPRRRFSGPPTTLSNRGGTRSQKYRSNFDLKLTEVSRELETYISRQVLCSVLTDGIETSPR